MGRVKKWCKLLWAIAVIIMYGDTIFINFISIPTQPDWRYWLLTVIFSIGLPVLCVGQWLYIDHLENKIEKLRREEE